jgi:hypothetical protein
VRTLFRWSFAAWVALFAAAQCPAQFRAQNTPIQHIIVIIQENRSPDNLFYADQNLVRSGAHLVGSGKCYDTQIALTPWRLDACFDPDHSHAGSWVPSYDSGKMDGACSTSGGVRSGCAVPACANSKYAYCPQYTYVPNTTYDGVHGILDPYFQLAEQYGFANYMFQTNQGPSFPAHQFLFAGTSAPTAYPDAFYDWFAAENLGSSGSVNGCIAPLGAFVREVDPAGVEGKGYTPLEPSGVTKGFPCYEHPTMSDLLNDNGITWKYYSSGDSSLWTAPNAINHICQSSGPGGSCEGPAFKNGQVVADDAQVLKDLGVEGASTSACKLPQVSWVTPDGAWSDHPGSVGSDGGPSWVAAIVNAVGGYDNSGNKLAVQCGYWANTAILITWDDWGGFYDDVDPISTIGLGNNGYPGGGGNGQAYVYGFRVPLIVVSPYARPGYISGPPNNPVCPNYYCHDFGSILNFIEYALGTNGNSLGTVGPEQWPYADAFVQDDAGFFGRKLYSLYDFFEFGRGRAFTPITGAKYATKCFLSPKSCFANFPEAADSD